MAGHETRQGPLELLVVDVAPEGRDLEHRLSEQIGVTLRDPDLDPQQVALTDAVVESARESGVTVWEQVAHSGEPIERLASLVALTDYAATYLALGLGLDPSVSRHVTELRDRTS